MCGVLGGMTTRLIRLVVGLALYGAGEALIVRAGLGVDPWTVLAQGISLRTGWGIGWIVNLLGLAVMLAWIPLRQRPGVGTLANILLLGTSMQVVLDLVPDADGIPAQVLTLLGGIVLVAFATGLYISAGLGPGPRDGLMTGLHSRFGIPIWIARGSIELTVLGVGWLLGGSVGIGTVAFALLIGPLVHRALPLLARRPRVARLPVSADGTPATASRA